MILLYTVVRLDRVGLSCCKIVMVMLMALIKTLVFSSKFFITYTQVV